MCVVKLAALQQLAAMMEPKLVGVLATGSVPIKVGQQPAGVDQTYPTVTITAGEFKFEPAYEDVHATIGDPADGVVVFNVGMHFGPVQIRVVATTTGERYKIEQAITNFFMSREGSPGIVVAPVTSCPDLQRFVAAFEYESDRWTDEMAWDRKYGSMILVTGEIPALVTRSEVYEMSELQLGITEDFGTPITPTTMVPPAVEVVLINQDGTITNVP